MAISPDGKRVAFVAQAAGGRNMLWVRPIDSLDARLLAGTQGATLPFWSPDSRFLGFFADGKLRKLDAEGGPVQILCEAVDGRGGTWNQEGVILFNPDGGAPFPLLRVSAAGGTPTPATRLDAARGDSNHRWPEFLPDGRHFILFITNTQTAKHAIAVTFDCKTNLISRILIGMLMAAAEGAILAGPVGTIALMFNGGEGSSQS